jgi:crotonobetainyl-CoA:carnitine CoA-transferase CaiB-like acyl-CoA transferase
MTDSAPARSGPLNGLKVLDLSRVLAGPWASQILGDLGADVFKIEHPIQGDDTRRWGPPFLADGSGDAAYYLCANRNKRSIAIDIAQAEGAALVQQLAAQCDIVLENFRVGGLAKYGLDYAALSAINPALIYCSVTGFGQTGPYKDRGGYDFLIQGMSGLMSVTGRPDDEPGGGPLKVGVATCDLSTGLYAAISILAALHHRDRTGAGQHIDCALLDTQVALLANQASNWLNGDMVPGRMANEHPNLAPYQDFDTADATVLIALGNDRQFSSLCAILGRPDLPADPRFADSAGRSVNRKAMQAELSLSLAEWRSNDLLDAMEQAGLPAGKVNSIPEICADPHIAARGLIQILHRNNGTPVRVPCFPAKFSATSPDYRRAPPRGGEDTRAFLSGTLGLDAEQIAALFASGIVADDQTSVGRTTDSP